MASRFDPSKLSAAIKRTGPLLRKNAEEMLAQVAKGFTKDIVAITPPGSAGVTGSAAKKQGEAAVSRDYGRAFRVIDEKFTQYMFPLTGQPAERESKWVAQVMSYVGSGRVGALGKLFADLGVKRTLNPHITKSLADSMRSANTGKMRASDLYATFPGGSAEALKKAKKNVGALAAGWLPAAVKYGVKLPAWVKGHDTPGSAKELSAPGKFQITLENASRYVGNVGDYNRRVESAMAYQTSKLERQADFMLKKAARAAGWH